MFKKLHRRDIHHKVSNSSEFKSLLFLLSLFLISKFQEENNFVLNINWKTPDICSIKKSITINKEAHFSFIPQDHILTNISFHKQYIKFPDVGEIYDYGDELIRDFTNFTWLYIWNLSYQYYHIQDVYFSTLNCFATGQDDTAYLLDSWFNKKGTFRVTNKFEDCIAITAPFGYGYYDFCVGTLTRIVYCPLDLLKKYPIIITGHGKYQEHARVVLEALGVKNPSFVQIDNEFNYDVIYCRNLYTVLPNFVYGTYREDRTDIHVHHSIYGPFACKIGDVMRKFYKIDNIPPKNYVVYNRPRGQQRSVTNIDEVYQRFLKEYPQYNITKYESNTNTVKESVQFYGMIKWMFAVTGANFFNCFFMAKHTGVLAFMPRRHDECFPAVLGSREIFFVIYKEYDQPFYGSPVTVELNRLMKYAKRSFEILENQHL